MRKVMLCIWLLLSIPMRLFSKISFFTMLHNSKVHKTSAIEPGCRIYRTKIGRYTYISRNCTITNSEIGSFCSIADNVMISPGKHPVDFVSTSPVFYSERNILKKCFNKTDFKESDETIIGNDVWIGSHAFIKGGVEIGDGSIIGAYTIVTKNIEPYSIVVGNPGRTIRKRFDDNTITRLLRSEWWNLDDKVLQVKAKNIDKIESFLEEVK